MKFLQTLFIVIMGIGLVFTSVSFANMQSANYKKKTVMNMYQYLTSLQYDHSKLTMKAMKKFYTPNVVMITNGKLAAKGYVSFYNHYKGLITHIAGYEFIFPKNSTISQKNRLAVRYTLSMRAKDGKTEKKTVIAFFSFKGKKISKWYEVATD